MTDFDEGAVFEWDDTLQGNADMQTGRELITQQELVRQSTRFPYSEPRTKPHTLAGLMALALGTVAATQDGIEDAYRHKITKGSSTGLPSIGALAKFDSGDQRQMRGLKADGFTLSMNGPFLSFASTLIGSGYRVADSTTFPAIISESWLRWGDAKLFVKDTGGTPISTVGAPTQGAANLGGSEVNLSSRVRTFSMTWVNSLAAEAGYRASTGLVRGDFHAIRRSGTVSIGIDVDTVTEATELGYYLSQNQLAFELNLDSGVLIDPQGIFKFGFIVIIPRLQLTSLPRSQTDNIDVLTMEGAIMDDATNSEIVAYVYNTRIAYLV
jgi:hypothetical protein